MGKGKPAPPGSSLARARIMAHERFDTLWKSGKMSRTQAYVWLAGRLGIPVKKCHMKQMNEEMCCKVVSLFAKNDFEDLS